MPIRRRPNGSWLVDFRLDGQRVRKTVKGDLSRKEVAALERRWRADAEAGRGSLRGGPTVGAILARYWTDHGRHLASAGSEKAYLDRWWHALSEDTKASTVTASRIASIVARWRSVPEVPGGKRTPRLLTAATINHRLRCLQRVWRMAADVWGHELQRIAWRRLMLDMPPPQDRTARVTAEALWRYLDALPPRSLWPTLWALNTGLRRGGLLSIHRQHLDWQAGVVHAVSKGRAGGRPTPIDMSAPVLAILQAMGRLPDIGPIFAVTGDQLRKDRERARVAAGLPDLRFHDLRHLFAQRLEDAGLGWRITDALHHADPRLRARYARARIRDVGRAVEEAERRLRVGNGHKNGH